ncbi:hypothetical protein [Limoniibacter endophyticus]|uniref:Uncharacterized protein n=1 Tax=Limoniibacter endophyticus TaxID=1565040 RepID=A0A8J3DJI0_9HYPH|nr:hypothetical protein [Limoniibacter endophyticus]GHC61491.1 hypothetical protein GCM10010136_02060 [Limoniibacter endophyticus]
MSDEPGTTSKTPSGLYEHYCEHPGYKEWGAFGYGRGKPSWFCYEHRDMGEMLLGMTRRN